MASLSAALTLTTPRFLGLHLSAVVVLAVFFWLLERAAGTEPATRRSARSFLTRLRGLYTGEDGRPSTSKLMTLVWTIVLGYVFAFLVAVTVLYNVNAFQLFLSDGLQAEYLFLLGGPFVALVAAKGIVGAKVQDGTLQKVNLENVQKKDERGGFTTNDDGKTDLVDAQYLLFNLVAWAYVVAVFLRQTWRVTHGQSGSVLPEIPETLFALTSAAALTYVGNKAVVQNAPAITAVTPSSSRPGDEVTIHGRNFVPPGSPLAPDHGANVTFDGVPAILSLGDKQPQVSDTSISAYVPPASASENVKVEVVTAAQAAANLTGFRVLENKAVIRYIQPPQLEPAKSVRIHGSFFQPPAIDRDSTTATPTPTVTFGSLTPEPAKSANDRELEVDVPPGLAPGSVVNVIVSPHNVRPSDPISVPVK